ncbi:E3 ubiquitin-protein ligase TRIM21-like [Odontesthes bonariensis]|uniref:E3 ubiquitin-protein ligase TRIM21-like n=1 Tax=Odontesthes bonariensis TaxID=219752 RepID=UPI003F5826FF
MAAASALLSEDQLQCSICLDVFTDPVTIPCGHNFCKRCITLHWDRDLKYQCPLCKELFSARPELRVNTFISEIAAHFRESIQKKASGTSKEQEAEAGEVLCDVCTETKLEALKSCLVCQTSYCETHLEPHQRIPGLKKHKLIHPVKDLEDRICKKHERLLEMFCKSDSVCVCQFCTETDHKAHDVVPLMEEYEGKKTELEMMEAHVQLMIQERRQKIEQIRKSAKLNKEDSDTKKESSRQLFTALIQSVEKSFAEHIGLIEENQKTNEKEAEDFIKELEKEISELMNKTSEMQHLLHNKDHFQFLRSFSSLKPAPPTKDWSEVRVHSTLERTLRRAVTQLEETLKKEMTKLLDDIVPRSVQQYAVDVTLDPETANVELVLSDDGKQVTHGGVPNLPDSPNKFSCYAVVGKQRFSSGRIYYEVQVKEKTDWNLGVVKESINRKSSFNDGFWALGLKSENKYYVGNYKISIFLKTKPEKVGVFVDYEEGLVSFYDVDTAALIYSFADCNFNERLYPIFNPCNNNGGKNSAPLIICPVN